MESPNSIYEPKLDHIRAIAAFLVFYWHVVHQAIPFSYVPDFPLFSLAEEGWIGVSVFMVLSGYLFANISNNRKINYKHFILNRIIRLAPLLVVVISCYSFIKEYSWIELLLGLVSWTWPVGAWSLTVELHFYLIFPLVLFLIKRIGVKVLFLVLIFSNIFRYLVWLINGEVQMVAYWSIIGHIDNFIFGMIAFHVFKDNKLYVKYLSIIGVCSFFLLILVWHEINLKGGFYLIEKYPSPSPLWVLLPTIEGLLVSMIIASYHRSKITLPFCMDRPLSYIGKISYSIYLWHYFLLITVAVPIFSWSENFLKISIQAIFLFIVMILIATISYNFIEKPFFRFRFKYIN